MDRSHHLCIIAWFGGVSAGGISLGACLSAFHTFSCFANEIPRGGFFQLGYATGVRAAVLFGRVGDADRRCCSQSRKGCVWLSHEKLRAAALLLDLSKGFEACTSCCA